MFDVKHKPISKVFTLHAENVERVDVFLRSFPIWAYHLNGLLQDCGITSALAMESLQFCTKLSIWS